MEVQFPVISQDAGKSCIISSKEGGKLISQLSAHPYARSAVPQYRHLDIL